VVFVSPRAEKPPFFSEGPMDHVTTLSPAVAKPSHIPDALVVDFDMFSDPAYLANPHGRVAEILATTGQIFWSPRNGGFWAALGHNAAFKASRDIDSFSSEAMPREQMEAILKSRPAGAPHIPQPYPINLDPPVHGTYRAPLQSAFSPKTITGLKDSIRDLAKSLIAKVRDQGHCEFMHAIAEPLPVEIFLNMLGLPVDRLAEYRALAKEHMAGINTSDTKYTMMRLIKVADIMRPTMLDRRDHPKNDILSLLWQTEIDGQPMTLEIMENYAVVLFIAGLDTVMNGMGWGVLHLAQNPDLQAQLRADPKLVADAAEEILRRYTFTVPPRRVAKDVVFEGVTMKENERLMLFLPGADLTASEFPQPLDFDMKRENKAHIAFGGGPHRCLGSHLARVELQILYEEILAGLPPFRIDPQHAPTFHGGHVIGPESLHIVWEI
jgi:cytochrome P450